MSKWTNGITRTDVYEAVTNAALRMGLHSPESDGWKTTSACTAADIGSRPSQAGMRRESFQELGGDSRKEARDLYDHIDLKEQKEVYLACVPQPGCTVVANRKVAHHSES